MTTSDDRIDLRPTGPGDLDGVLDLFEVVAAEGVWIGAELPLDRASRKTRMRTTIDAEDSLSLVAVGPSGRVCGQLALVHDGMGHADLSMLLHPDARGRGLGGRLMVEAIEWATARPELHKICLQHWPSNVAAHALYRRHGFLVEGYLHRHWRRNDGSLWDAVVMGLAVGD